MKVMDGDGSSRSPSSAGILPKTIGITRYWEGSYLVRRKAQGNDSDDELYVDDAPC